jgi:hypothetical protein
MSFFATELDNDDNEDFLGDDLYSGGNDLAMGQRDYTKVANKIFNEGFIAGKVIGVELLRQENFDTGFEQGIVVGQECGRFYGHCRVVLALSKTMAVDDASIQVHQNCDDLLKRVEKLLFFDIAQRKRAKEAIVLDLVDLASAITLLPYTGKVPKDTFIEEAEKIRLLIDQHYVICTTDAGFR